MKSIITKQLSLIIFLSLSAPLCAIAYAIHLAGFILSPIYEQANCVNNTCYISEISVFGVDTRQINDKNQIEIVSVKDSPITNQYFIRIKDDNEEYFFRSPYFIKRNAKRDLNKILTNSNIKIAKKNVFSIQFICATIAIILFITITYKQIT